MDWENEEVFIIVELLEKAELEHLILVELEAAE